MCFFLFIGVRDAHRGDLEQMDEVGVSVRQMDSPALNNVFPTGHAIFEITQGGCSCDLFVNRSGLRLREKQRRRYERKGWSKPKIDRAIHAKMQRGSLAERTVFRDFKERICTLARSVGEVCLYAHWFSGKVFDEELSRSNELHLSVIEYTKQSGVYPEDTLVHVRGGTGKSGKGRVFPRPPHTT